MSSQMSSLTSKPFLSSDELDSLVLRYLSLPETYTPNPSTLPIAFLRLHLSILPSSILQHFSFLLSPRQRTTLSAIRNRRLTYHTSAPTAFSFPIARNKWVDIWDEIAPGAVLQENWRDTSKSYAEDEKAWAEAAFLDGETVAGKKSRLGRLLADYEEERVGEVERANRSARLRKREARKAGDREAELQDTEEEEEEEELSEDDQDAAPAVDNQQLKGTFERVLKERFIAGLLKVSLSHSKTSVYRSFHQNFDYDPIDWSDKWDVQSRDDEDRWFQEDDDDEEENVTENKRESSDPISEDKEPEEKDANPAEVAVGTEEGTKCGDV